MQYEQGQGQGQPQPQGRRPVLPKFGEWNVNDPAAGDGYTVVFTKARDEKKAKATIGNPPPPPPPPPAPVYKNNMRPTRSRNQSYDHSTKVSHFNNNAQDHFFNIIKNQFVINLDGGFNHLFVRMQKKWICCFGGSNVVEDRY